MAQCRVELSAICLADTRASDVLAGAVVFDDAAASACYRPLACDSQLPVERWVTGFAQFAACRNVVTGYALPGSGCTSDVECARSGEYSTCYRPSGVDPGVCATVVIDEDRCGFSFDDNELRFCPDDKFCDIVAMDREIQGSPTEMQFVFSAPCRARVAAGQSCIDTRTDAELLVCQAGLFCALTSTDEATCVQVRTEGETCDPGSTLVECAEGLVCGLDAKKPKTCARPENLDLFCVAP